MSVWINFGCQSKVIPLPTWHFNGFSVYVKQLAPESGFNVYVAYPAPEKRPCYALCPRQTVSTSTVSCLIETTMLRNLPQKNRKTASSFYVTHPDPEERFQSHSAPKKRFQRLCFASYPRATSSATMLRILPQRTAVVRILTYRNGFSVYVTHPIQEKQLQHCLERGKRVLTGLSPNYWSRVWKLSKAMLCGELLTFCGELLRFCGELFTFLCKYLAKKPF